LVSHATGSSPIDPNDDESTLVLNDGTTAQAAYLEQVLAQKIPAIKHVMVVGSRQEKLCCLLTLKTVPGTDQLAPEAMELARLAGSTAQTVQEARSDLKYRQALLQGFTEANKELETPARRLTKFAVLPKDLTVEAGDLNPDGSLNRLAIKNKSIRIIEGMTKPAQ